MSKRYYVRCMCIENESIKKQMQENQNQMDVVPPSDSWAI